ncbi:C4-dicarboxylate TRAP transporter substrate-binding protein [Roseibium sp. RKSG952]|uniref:C4-dicarboxylate TRAP transporter substrate-binding protein n=1 Tax=Roseibium sp. RKSG952 TaxID=2529384 RepID=UPI0012BD5319|nr:C4-dicarboxylate TRAP transporter substrate-binding protein [Roseibium sp. RKSG952]MTH99780.1 C4-dicarboxylate ABC transporter substrate-binding protein [Roseibium sp. RKSG952]
MRITDTVAAVTTVTLGLVFVAETFAAEVTWNASLWGNRRALTENVEKLAEEVSKRTNGEFVINLNYGEVLSKARENLDGISIGAFELAQVCVSYHADKTPSLTVLELPFLGISGLEERVEVSNALYGHPAVQKDLARWNAKPLMPSPIPQSVFAGKGDPPGGISDLDGMRVRAVGGHARMMETAGAIPTSVTAPEVYQAFDSGLVEAVAFPPYAHLSYKTIEIADWWISNLNFGTSPCPLVVNIDAYEALPDEYRQALDDSVGPALDHYLAVHEAFYDQWWPELDRRGIVQVEFSDDEVAVFKERAVPIRNAWIKEQTSKGLPAQDLLDFVNTTVRN